MANFFLMLVCGGATVPEVSRRSASNPGLWRFSDDRRPVLESTTGDEWNLPERQLIRLARWPLPG